MHRIETSEWLAEISLETGANLCRLQHRGSGLELLRSPSSETALMFAPERYGIPVLFPPNRIDGGSFKWRGRHYELPLNEGMRGNHIHGVALRRQWNLAEGAGDKVVMNCDFSATPGYPHDFTLTLSYTFRDDAVHQEFRVDNRSSQPMPFGLGYHTAFRLPPDGTVRMTAGKGYWEIANARFLPTGRLVPWSDGRTECVFHDNQIASGHFPVTTELIDSRPFRGAVIEYPSEHARIYYEVDEVYKHWCIWNGGGNSGFFCPEPMTCMINAPNLELPPEVTGMLECAPGGSWTAHTSIRLVKGKF